MKEWFAVGVGGAAGAVARYVLGGLVQRWLGGGFPWGTLAVNVAGCFGIGLAWAMIENRGAASVWHAFWIAGVLGGFTTFSAFGNETWHLAASGAWARAATNAAAQVGLGFLAVWAGHVLSRRL